MNVEASLAQSAQRTLDAPSLAIELELETSDPQIEARADGSVFSTMSRIRIDRVGDRTDGTVSSDLVGDFQFWTSGERTVLTTSSGFVDYIPSTASTSLVDDIDLMIDILSTSPSEMTAEDEQNRIYSLRCGDRASELQGSFYAVLCHPEVDATVTVAKETGRITSIQHEGPFPIYPGRTLHARGKITYSEEAAIEDDPPFGEADPEPLACVARSFSLTVNDSAEISERIQPNTTEENGQLFTGCGFTIYPPGRDLYETD